MEHSPWKLVSLLNQDIRETDDFLCSDFSVEKARKIWLQKSLVKKFEPRVASKTASEKAIALWYEMNTRCQTSFKIPDGTCYYDDILSDARDLMYKQLNTWDGSLMSLDRFFYEGRNGPGKSAAVPFADTFSKSFGESMSMKDSFLLKHYTSKLEGRWEAAENRRASLHPTALETPAVLFCVRKTSEIDRVALKEPSLNMFYQLGAAETLKRVLRKHHSIDMSTQPQLNGHLARLGSKYGNFCTIDLKSASDTIAKLLVAWLIDRLSLAPLNMIRSDYAEGPDGTTTDEIHMFSSMGNGFNSTLQTLIFATLIKATYRSLGIPMRDPETGLPTYSVFGDDIICTRPAYYRVIAVLERCGFIVNSEKSYCEGPFRESCGKDYFMGHNIRGVYIRKLWHDNHVYSVFNRLARWSARNGISIPRILQYLVGQAEFRPVPFDKGDTAGFQWPSCLLTNRKVDELGAIYYRCLRPVPSRRVANARLNPNGAITAFIGGHLTCGYADTRHGRKLVYFAALRQDDESQAYTVVRESSSSWDWIPYAGVTLRDYVHTVIVVK